MFFNIFMQNVHSSTFLPHHKVHHRLLSRFVQPMDFNQIYIFDTKKLRGFSITEAPGKGIIGFFNRGISYQLISKYTRTTLQVVHSRKNFIWPNFESVWPLLHPLWIHHLLSLGKLCTLLSCHSPWVMPSINCKKNGSFLRTSFTDNPLSDEATGSVI